MKPTCSVMTAPIVSISGAIRMPFSRDLVIDHLERGRYRDLYDRIVEERNKRPTDLELLRCLRVLEWYFSKKKTAA